MYTIIAIKAINHFSLSVPASYSDRVYIPLLNQKEMFISLVTLNMHLRSRNTHNRLLL